jgi:glycosyltransferase involved in cell wall biosynthesis
MKIAYICTDTRIPILGNKGASVHIREIVSNLIKLGNKVFIIAACKGKGFKNNHNLYEIKPIASKKLGSDLSKILTNIKFFFTLIGIFSREKPEAIYERYESYCFAGILLAKLFSIPHILEVNAPLLAGPRRRLKFYGLVRLIEGMVFRLTNGVVLTTNNLRDYVERMGVKDINLHVIPDGVDIEKFRPITKKDENSLKKLKLENSFVIGFVGSLMPRQGLEVLIEACKSLKYKIELPLKYFIIGTGRREKRLKNIVKNYDLEKDFIFLKDIKHEDIPSYINLMDICVLPNMSIYSSPIKIFEYMAMKKPVILPRKGQPLDIFTHLEDCFFIEPGNKEQLIEAIQLLSEDENLRKKLGANAREKVSRQFTWLKSAEKTIEVYNNLKV